MTGADTPCEDTTPCEDVTPWSPSEEPRPHGTDLRDGHRNQCTARAKQSGERCRAYAVRGATVCRAHGGAAAQVKAKAEARLLARKAEADATRALAHEAVERLTDPLEALSKLAVEALALKEALAARVNARDDLEAVQVALYERALDRSAKFLDLLLRNNWEERRVELEQARAQLVTTAVVAGLDALSRSLPGGLLPAGRSEFLRAFLTGIGRGPSALGAGEG